MHKNTATRFVKLEYLIPCSPSPVETFITVTFSFSSCSIVRSFEGIVSMFAQQPGDQSRIPFMTENILLVTELVSLITP